MKSNLHNDTTLPRPSSGEAALFRRYNQYLRLERGFSDNTLDAYLKDLQKLIDYYEAEGIDFRGVTLEQLQTFVASLMDLGITPRSIARILAGVRSFYKFLLLEREIDTDPTELLESPARGHHLPDVLTVEEIDQLIATIDLSKIEGQRDRAILETLYSCGLRVSELCHLKISDLYLNEGFIRVHGKGKKERLVPISIIKELCKAVGIRSTVSPHTFRHSFATHLLEGGANLRAIQEMLGHEGIATTEIYMHIDSHHLREEILMHHPRNIQTGDELS